MGLAREIGWAEAETGFGWMIGREASDEADAAETADAAEA